MKVIYFQSDTIIAGDVVINKYKKNLQNYAASFINWYLFSIVIASVLFLTKSLS